MIFNLAVTTKWPIERDHCAVHIHNYQYSILSIQNGRQVDIASVPGEDTRVFFSICNPLNASELPAAAQELADLRDAYAVRCTGKLGSETCEPILYVNDFDWRPYDPLDFSKGVTYYALGQPYKKTVTQEWYRTFDLTLNFLVDPTAKAEDPEFDYSIQTIIANQSYHLTGTMRSERVAVKNVGQPPAPTPSYSPDCDYMKRSEDVDDLAMILQFADINGGMYGLRQDVTVRGQKQVLFFQPCERMKCPEGYTCATVEYSSAWLCDDQDPGTRPFCMSFGLAPEILDVDAVEGLPGKFIYNLPSAGQSGRLELTGTCDRLQPENHLIISGQATMDMSAGDSVLHITATSREACYDPVDPPHPPVGTCSVEYIDSSTGQYILFSLIKHNLVDKEGDHVGKHLTPADGLQVGGMPGYVPNHFYYEPCGGIHCPDHADNCEGDEDATVWLCSESGECTGYGLFENDVTISHHTHGNLSNGIDVKYKGDMNRYAVANWVCDSYGKENEFTVDPIMEIDATTGATYLRFTVKAVSACADHRATWHPVRPTPGPTPSPTPLPWPNPVLAYMEGDEYIAIDLSRLSQSTFDGMMKLGSTDITKEASLWKVVYHPWTETSCPSGYVCDSWPDSNIWGCWTEDDGTNYCHAIADRFHGTSMYPSNANNLSAGIHILMEGAHGVNADIVVTCDKSTTANTLTFDSETLSVWAHTGYGIKAGEQVRFYTDSPAACVQKFVNPVVPSVPTATPVPEPYDGNFYYYTNEHNDGLASSINLKEINQVFAKDVMVGYPGRFAKMSILFNPTEKVAAPLGYEPLSTAKSNLWKCGRYDDGKDHCEPIGDMDVGIDFSVHGERGHRDGISLKYLGGYNMANTTLVFLCNNSVGTNVNFEPIIELWGSSNEHVIRAHTALVCLAPLQHFSATGGGWFLLIVFVGALAYFSIGTLYMFAKHDFIEIPNSSFWYQVGDSVKSVILFIFTCGKRVEGGSSNYDTI